jgi:hypothetical protein
LKDRLRLPDRPIAQQGIHTRAIVKPGRKGPTVPVDRAGMPDLSVRWIISIGGGGDSRDSTTNETGRGALAIAEPTPNGY